jgi:hypothetical protein
VKAASYGSKWGHAVQSRSAKPEKTEEPLRVVFAGPGRPARLRLVGDTVGGVLIGLGNGGVWRRINNGTEG